MKKFYKDLSLILDNANSVDRFYHKNQLVIKQYNHSKLVFNYISKVKKVTDMLGFGWNLGNHFDSYEKSDETNNYKITWSDDCPYWDSVNPTKSLYESLASLGVKTVRIPVTWGPYLDMTDGNYTIDSDYMSIVKLNVLWAKASGLNVVLNTHHDEYWLDAYTAYSNSTTNDSIKDRLRKTWSLIATEFKDEGEYLILETFNELNNNWKTPIDGELLILNEWNLIAVDVIRSSGGENANRWISIPSYMASPTYALNDIFQLPTDTVNKLIVAVHCYDPYNFTIASELDETWGHLAGNSNDEKDITDLFNNLKTKFLSKNIPCYLGEFGCSIHTTDLGEKCREYYLEYFCRAAHEAGLAITVWDNNVSTGGSESHGYINHEDGTWANDSAKTIFPMMIKAATSNDTSYTLDSIYNKAPEKS